MKHRNNKKTQREQTSPQIQTAKTTTEETGNTTTRKETATRNKGTKQNNKP